MPRLTRWLLILPCHRAGGTSWGSRALDHLLTLFARHMGMEGVKVWEEAGTLTVFGGLPPTAYELPLLGSGEPGPLGVLLNC